VEIGKKKLKFSIIVPSLNQGKFIRETIESVLNQDYEETELIVVDGGSKDETLDILRSYGSRLGWTSEKDRGQSHAINKGLQRATGDIVAFINSDDYYLPGAFSAVSDFFSRNHRHQWVTGDYVIIDENGKRIFPFVVLYKRLLRLFPYFWMLSFTDFIVQPSTFWRRDVVSEVGLFDEELHYVMDYDYWLRLMRKYPLGVMRTPLSAFRVHRGSKGGAQYKKQFESELEIVKKYVDNNVILKLHEVHNRIIVKVYDFIK
jgi:glycosyltransferase involved in cell wall biosynthesis